MTATTGLIVGVGSVGRRHAAVMAERYEELIVVDPNPNARSWAENELGTKVTSAESLDHVAPKIIEEADQVTAVISSWGPHHYPAISSIVEMGVRRVFCEKPLATSLREIESIRQLCERDDIALTAGLHLRYRGISEFIQRVSQELLGGPPTTMVVDGGARCIATNGSHWTDLTVDVFGDTPSAVTASLHGSPINPRSPELLYWDGVSVWEFPHGQRLSVTYDNASSVHERVRLYSPTGVIEIDPSFRVCAYQRDPREVSDDPRVTRVGEVLRDQPVAEFKTDFSEVLSLQLDELEGLRPPSYARDAVISSALALVAAFESSRLGRRLTFPLSQEIVSDSIEWMIS